MKYLIIGWGRTGQALYKYLEEKKEDIYVYDDKEVHIDHYYNYETIKRELPLFDIGIISPGFNVRNEKYRLIHSLCHEIISEIDFACRQKKLNIIGVTGSNGKTTLATYLAHFLSLKCKVFLAGNIGTPLIEVIPKVKQNDIIVLELSSFQIRDSREIQLKHLFFTSFCLNHLDHYDSQYHYMADKKRVSFFVDKEHIYDLSNINISNEEMKKISFLDSDYAKKYALIAMKFALNYGIDESFINENLKTLKPVLYRFNPIRIIRNFTFVNDSKSTTVDSSMHCYEMYKNKENVILILGGIHKSDSFSKLKINHHHQVFIYGRDKEIIKSQIEGLLFPDLESIFYEFKKLKKETMILFSPGCDSHDLYSSYIERGEHFEMLINQYLKEKEKE